MHKDYVKKNLFDLLLSFPSLYALFMDPPSKVVLHLLAVSCSTVQKLCFVLGNTKVLWEIVKGDQKCWKWGMD